MYEDDDDHVENHVNDCDKNIYPTQASVYDHPPRRHCLSSGGNQTVSWTLMMLILDVDQVEDDEDVD